MVTVAVIGAGNIGSRHLQALAKSARIERVEALGRSTASLKLAEERYRSVRPQHQTALFARAASELSGEIDVAIVATNSDTRLSALRELLHTHQVGAVILEKVAF